MPEHKTCSNCDALLPEDAPAGICPKCLLLAGLDGSDGVHEPDCGSAFAATTPQTGGFVPPEPTRLAPLFPHLEIIELIGHGGMGAVYKARQTKLDRLVALKIIRPESADDAAFAERFNREARTLARLNHPHIVAIYDFGEVTTASGGRRSPDDPGESDFALFYFLMEYVDGATLRQLIQTDDLSPDEALAIVPQICDALQFAHDEGIVHRDVKPENILLDQRGRVKIADFGLAKLATRSEHDFTLTGTHQVMGTPRYMAPEQMEGSRTVDHRADIYSLGVVFYEMLTGQVPAGHFDPPSKRTPVDDRLDQVVMRALAHDPERRYQQASEISSHVNAIRGMASDVYSTPAAQSSRRAFPEPPAGPSTMLDRAVSRIVASVRHGDIKQSLAHPATVGIAAILMCVAGVATLFIPWAFNRGVVADESHRWIYADDDSWGLLAGIVFFALGLTLFAGSPTDRRPRWRPWTLMFCGAVLLGLVLLFRVNVMKMSVVPDGSFFAAFGLSLGLMLFGAWDLRCLLSNPNSTDPSTMPSRAVSRIVGDVRHGGVRRSLARPAAPGVAAILLGLGLVATLFVPWGLADDIAVANEWLGTSLETGWFHAYDFFFSTAVAVVGFLLAIILFAAGTSQRVPVWRPWLILFAGAACLACVVIFHKSISPYDKWRVEGGLFSALGLAIALIIVAAWDVRMLLGQRSSEETDDPLDNEFSSGIGGRDWVTLTKEQIEADDLPDVCIVCGRPTTERLNRNFSHQSEWAGILTLVGMLFFVIPGVIISSLTERRQRIACPICPRHRNHWSRFVWWASTGWLIPIACGGTGALVGSMVAPGHGGVIPGAAMGALVTGLFAYLVPLIRMASRCVDAEEITDTEIRLRRVSAAFAREAGGRTPSAGEADDRPEGSDEPRFSRKAILGACWAGLFFAALAVLIPLAVLWVSRHEVSSREQARQNLEQIDAEVTGQDRDVETVTDALPREEPHTAIWPMLLLGILSLPIIASPFATTILGWTALSEIRSSDGRIIGLGLAFFDAMLFPMLFLYAVLFGLVLPTVGWPGFTPEPLDRVVLATSVIAAILWVPLALLILRRAWRAVALEEDESDTEKPGEAVSFPGRELAIMLTIVMPLFALIGFSMAWTNSAWALAGLALPWFALGGCGCYYDGRPQERAANVAGIMGLLVSLGLIGYGVVLEDSLLPLLAVFSGIVGAFAGMHAGAAGREDESDDEQSQEFESDHPEDEDEDVTPDDTKEAETLLDWAAGPMFLLGLHACFTMFTEGSEALLASLRGEPASLDPTFWFTLAGPIIVAGAIAMWAETAYWLAITACVLCLPLGLSYETPVFRIIPFLAGGWGLLVLLTDARCAFKPDENETGQGQHEENPDGSLRTGRHGLFGESLRTWAVLLGILIGGPWLMSLLMSSGRIGPASTETANLKSATVTDLLKASDVGDLERISQILAEGIDVNSKDASGTTALMSAAAHGRASLCQALLLLDANAGDQDHQGRTALMHAVMYSREEVIRGFFEIESRSRMVDASEQLRSLNLDWKLLEDVDLSRIGSIDIATEARDYNGETALMKAAASGNEICVKALLGGTYVVGVDMRDKEGRTALMHAVINRQTSLIRSLANAAYDRVAVWSPETLGDMNTFNNSMLGTFSMFDVDSLRIADDDGKTAYQLSEEQNSTEIAELLRKYLELVIAKETQAIEMDLVGVRWCYRDRAYAYQALGETEKADADLAKAGEVASEQQQ